MPLDEGLDLRQLDGLMLAYDRGKIVSQGRSAARALIGTMIDDAIEISGHHPAVPFMARPGSAGPGSLTLLLAVRRRRLRGRARRLLRTLNLQHQIDQLFLRQTLQITAFHTDRDLVFARFGKGVGNYQNSLFR